MLKKIERSGKLFLLQIYSFFVRNKVLFENLIGKEDEIKSILLLRLEQKLGNNVMTTFFPQTLQDIYGDIDIDIFVHAHNADVWDNNPYINNTYSYQPSVHLKNPLKLIGILFRIRKNKYDLILDVSNPGSFSVSNGMLTRFLGKKYRVGFRRGDSDKFLNVLVNPDHNKHYMEINRDLLRLLHENVEIFDPHIYLTDDEINLKADMLTALEYNDEDTLILMWIGARHSKQWEIINFVELKSKLESEPGIRVIYALGPDERRYLATFEELEKKSVLYIDEFKKLASIINKCDLFVSGDCGPLHLAYALNTRSVGIFLFKNYDNYGYDNGQTNRLIDLSAGDKGIDEVRDLCRDVLACKELSH